MRKAVNVVDTPDTFHFNVGNIGAITLGTPNVATPAAMSFFGQINIAYARRIRFTHLHLIDDGVAPSVINAEIWRRRSGAMTRLTQMTYTAPFGSDFVEITAVPTDNQLWAGDYLFAQVVTGTTIAGGGNGLTLDVHYSF